MAAHTIALVGHHPVEGSFPPEVAVHRFENLTEFVSSAGSLGLNGLHVSFLNLDPNPQFVDLIQTLAGSQATVSVGPDLRSLSLPGNVTLLATVSAHAILGAAGLTGFSQTGVPRPPTSTPENPFVTPPTPSQAPTHPSPPTPQASMLANPTVPPAAAPEPPTSGGFPTPPLPPASSEPTPPLPTPPTPPSTPAEPAPPTPRAAPPAAPSGTDSPFPTPTAPLPPEAPTPPRDSAFPPPVPPSSPAGGALSRGDAPPAAANPFAEAPEPPRSFPPALPTSPAAPQGPSAPAAPQRPPAFAQPPASPQPPLVSNFGALGSTAPHGRGAVLLFSAPKGGTGKTTLSTNVAAFITLHTQKRVAFLDFNIRQGDALLRLGLGPAVRNRQTFKTVEDLYRNIANVTPETIHQFMAPVTHVNSHKFFALLPPVNVRAYDPTIYDDVFFEKAIGVMRQAFDFIIIDTGSFESDNKLHILAERIADRVTWVAGMDRATSAQLKPLLQSYNEVSRHHYPYTKHGWVLNARIDNEDVGVEPEQLIANLGPVGVFFGSLPYDPSFKRASNQFELIVQQRQPYIDAAFRDIIKRIVEPDPLPSLHFPELEHLSPVDSKGGILGGLKKLFGG